MARDSRYKSVKALIENGTITHFNQMFEFIPKSIVAADMGKQNIRFTRLMGHVEKFTLEDIYTLAKFLEVQDNTVYELAYKEYLHQKGKKKS